MKRRRFYPIALVFQLFWELKIFTVLRLFRIKGGRGYGLCWSGRRESKSPHTKPLKRKTKIAADDILIFHFYLSKKIRLDFSYESSAKQKDSLETSNLIFSEKQ